MVVGLAQQKNYLPSFGWIAKVFTQEVKSLFFEIVSLYPN